MITYLNYYLIVGIIWLLIHEILGFKMNNGMRLRLLLAWPVTLSAWIIGFVDAMYNSFFDNEE